MRPCLDIEILAGVVRTGDGVGTAYTSRLRVNAEEWTAPGSQRRDRRGDDAGYDAHSRK